MHSWAGSLERFLAEFSHGRGLGILHPNLNGAVSFARQVPSGTGWEEEEEMLSQTQTEGGSTPTPTLRGTEEGEREPETLIRTYKDANLVVSTFQRLNRWFFLWCASHQYWKSSCRCHACAFIPRRVHIKNMFECCEVMSDTTRGALTCSEFCSLHSILIYPIPRLVL